MSKTTKQNNGVELNLDIPNLPENVEHVNWQVPISEGYEWINYKDLMEKVSDKKTANYTDDEGFFSVKFSPLSLKDDKENALWDQVLDYSISDYLDWDMRNE